MCALILEPLLNSNIDSIVDLNLLDNQQWFRKSEYDDDLDNNVLLITELITK